MNKFIVMGRIASDLSLQTTPGGINFCKFRIAVERNFQQKGEEKKTDFFNAVAWRVTAEFLVKHFAKGRLILVDGEMQTTPYTDKSGNSSVWYEIMCDKIFFTGEKATAPAPPEYAGDITPEPPPAMIYDYPEDYPF